jgi:DNA-binding NarL/FixJ family response regulator
MTQISDKDLRGVLDCIEKLQDLCELDDLPARIINLLSPLIGSEAGFCSSFTNTCNTLAVTAPEFHILQLGSSYFQENPLIGHYFQTHDCKAYKISDFLTEQEVFRREALHGAFLHVCGLADQLAMVIPEKLDLGNTRSASTLPSRYFPPGNMQSLGVESTLGNLALGFHRTNRSFTEREREILNLLHPYIINAYRNSQVYTRLQQQLSQFSQALDDLGSVILSLSGRIRFISPRALQLLSQYFPGSSLLGDQLPETLQSWVKGQIHQRQNPLSQPLQIEQADKRLTIRLLGSMATGHFILALEETSQQSFSVESLRLIGLTQRQSKVLFWVAKGKSNIAIAETLILSKRTIEKHLESASEKLGVKNRTDAVTTALKLLGMLDC